MYIFFKKSSDSSPWLANRSIFYYNCTYPVSTTWYKVFWFWWYPCQTGVQPQSTCGLRLFTTVPQYHSTTVLQSNLNEAKHLSAPFFLYIDLYDEWRHEVKLRAAQWITVFCSFIIIIIIIIIIIKGWDWGDLGIFQLIGISNFECGPKPDLKKKKIKITMLEHSWWQNSDARNVTLQTWRSNVCS